MFELDPIREHTCERIRQTPFVTALLAADLPLSLYAHYLTNVYHYACHSARVIGAAGARCTRSHPMLARYLLAHATEEMGHEDWARQDLRELGVDAAALDASRPVPACTAMIAFEYYVSMHANPVALFGWMFTLEALGDDLAHAAASQLAHVIGKGARGIGFLEGHGHADHTHIREITDHLQQHLTSPKDRRDVSDAARLSADLYVAMLEQIGREQGT